MRKITFIFIMVLGALLFACGDDAPQFSPLKPNATIVFLGDSLTFGTGAKSGEDIPSLIENDLGYKAINMGIPGHTTRDGLDRIEEVLSQQQADLLIIGLGGNDFLRHVPLNETKANLLKMIALAKARQVKVALMAIPKPSLGAAAFGTLEDHPVYQEIAKEEKIPLFEEIFTEALSSNATKADQIHPNAQGYLMAKERLVSELKRTGLRR